MLVLGFVILEGCELALTENCSLPVSSSYFWQCHPISCGAGQDVGLNSQSLCVAARQSPCSVLGNVTCLQTTAVVSDFEKYQKPGY